jgi:signal recognition particle GTPase
MHILNRQKEFFTEESLSMIRKSRDLFGGDLFGGDGRDLVLDTKDEIGNEDRKDSFEETKMAGAGEEEVNNDEEATNKEEINNEEEAKKDANGGNLRGLASETKEQGGDEDRGEEELNNDEEATNKEEVGNEEEAKTDAKGGTQRSLFSEKKEEGGDEDRKASLDETLIEKEINNEEEEEFDDDVSRKDPFYGSEEATDAEAAEPPVPPAATEATEPPVPPAATELLLFVAVIVGLVIAWCARKIQRKRSGLHKKIDE